MKIASLAIVMFGLAAAAQAQTAPAEKAPADKVTVAFSDPARPGIVKTSLIVGSITVTAYNGKEVIVEAVPRSSPEGRGYRIRKRDEAPAPTTGLKRIPMASTGLTVEEENNTMTVGVPSHNTPVDLTIQVPTRTSLNLRAHNGGDIKVDGVQGEIEVNNLNGKVTLTNISGSAVAHALNGGITATFAQVDPQKPMSFSSMNGNIDVTFPADLKANVKVKSDHGEIFTDFDIAMQATPKTVVEDSRSKGGRYRVQIDRTFYGTINGGGREIQFSNYNGGIYIRKK